MLTEKQKQAARMLFEMNAGYSDNQVKDIAAVVGVHRCTLWRWMQRREFRKEVNHHKRIWQKRVARLQEKTRREIDRKADEALQKWEDDINRCIMRMNKAELCGDPLSKEFQTAQISLKNAMNQDPFRDIVPKWLRKNSTLR